MPWRWTMQALQLAVHSDKSTRSAELRTCSRPCGWLVNLAPVAHGHVRVPRQHLKTSSHLAQEASEHATPLRSTRGPCTGPPLGLPLIASMSGTGVSAAAAAHPEDAAGPTESADAPLKVTNEQLGIDPACVFYASVLGVPVAPTMPPSKCAAPLQPSD
jgi:hypothetical protein